MAQFSVKRPFTVLVCVIAILVLGFVAFTSMTPDLLPSMELPYVMLITSYPGATPERVETVVTKPLEQVMATLENIENISSTSSENMSMLVLEFSSDVNMESVTVDILQYISRVQGYWDDSVGTPLILKLNPDMLPVMVAAVEREGLDTAALSGFADETLINKLEGIAGVATVSASGLVEQQVNVVLSESKIIAANQRIARAIENNFDDAKKELDDTGNEIQDQLSDVEDGIAATESGLEELIEQSAAAEAALDAKQQELLQGKIAVQMQILMYQTELQMLVEQGEALVQLNAAITPLQQTVAQNNAIVAQLEPYKARLEALTATQAGYEARIAAATTQDEIDAIMAEPGYADMVQAFADLDAELAAMGYDAASMMTAYATAATTAAIAQQTIDAALAALPTPMTEQEYNTAWAAYLQAIEDAEAGIAEAQALLAQLDAGQIALNEAMLKLEQLKGATQMEIYGGSAVLQVLQIQLEAALDQLEDGYEKLADARLDTLRAANLNQLVTMDMISNILKAQNFSMPAGYVTQDGVDYLVRVGDLFASPDELRELLLLDMGIEGTAPVYLRDVADIFVSDNLDSIYAKIDGNDGVLLTFNKQSNYATAEVSENITAKFEQLSGQYPGLRFTPLMDQGDYIFIVVDSIMSSLLWGAVFAIIILFLFLKDLKPTFITLCSIPISVMFALVLMYFSGISLNIISMSGLAVAVGMLVDNSVVVIENIYRLRGLGVSAVQAAVSGAAQVAGAIASSTLTTICVFAPIVFVEGITRQLFTDMALTLAYALLASLVVAMTLVPAMSAGMLKNSVQKENKLLGRALRVYERSLGWTLRHKLVTTLATIALLVASVLLVLMRGFSFMPSMDMPQLSLTVSMPEGSTLATTRQVADEVMARVQTIDGVETVGAIAGGGNMLSSLGLGGGGDADASQVTMYVMLDENGPGGKRVGDEILAKTTDLDCEVNVSSSSGLSTAMLGASGLEVEVYGDNLDELYATARLVAAQLETLPGVAEADDGIGETEPEIRFIINKNKAMREELTVAQVFSELSKALTEETTATSITWQGEDYSVIVDTGKADKLTPEYIRNFSFTVTTRDGEEKTIAVKDVADIVETETATAISRNDQRRTVSVSATVAEGHNVSLVTGEAERLLADTELPPGISLEFTGENETILASFRDLLNMLLLGVLLVYLIMVAQFQSLKSPFIVMFTIPLAFTGGFLALLVTGMELSVIALIGFVMLVGIIVNNGIVLVDYINQLRREGAERRAAITEAGVTRMRPILMTSLTTILGLSVMAVGTGTGSELMQPVAIVCIGGLLYATLMTLYIVPIMYDTFNKKELRVIKDEELHVLSDDEDRELMQATEEHD